MRALAAVFSLPHPAASPHGSHEGHSPLPVCGRCLCAHRRKDYSTAAFYTLAVPYLG